MTESESIYVDENYIKSKKYKHSLEKFQDSHPDGASNKVISYALGIREEVVEKIQKDAMMKLKELFQG